MAEDDLANTQAVWRMMQTVFSMVAMAVMLSLAGSGECPDKTISWLLLR